MSGRHDQFLEEVVKVDNIALFFPVSVSAAHHLGSMIEANPHQKYSTSL